MKIKRTILFALLFVFSAAFFCGCWNYSDIEKYSLVTGLSVDMDKKDDKYIINAEVLNYEMSGKEAKSRSSIVEAEGKTVFDAVRNMINVTGKKMYWGHAEIFIISKDIAEKGIIPVLDLAYRDAEIREEMHVIISNKSTAKEMLQDWNTYSDLKCFEIEKMIEGQKTLSNAPLVRLYELVNNIEENDISPALPAIDMITRAGKYTPTLIGTAVFKSDKLVGFLDKEESKYYLFVTDQIDKGLLIENIMDGNKDTKVTLEIFKSSTEMKPALKDGKLGFNMNIRIDASIAEVDGSKDFIQESGRERLKKAAEESLKISIENMIHKVQNQYDTDIFGFRKHLKADSPSAWERVESNWDNAFKNINSDVYVEIQLRNSALNSRTIKIER